MFTLKIADVIQELLIVTVAFLYVLSIYCIVHVQFEKIKGVFYSVP